MALRVVVLDHPFTDLEPEHQILGALGAAVVDAQGRSQAEHRALCRSADAILVRRTPLRRDLIASLERCLIICNYGSGYDNVDVAAATEHGILVANTVGYCDEEVADHALTLMLALARRLVPQLRDLAADAATDRDIGWSHKPYTPIRRLCDQTLGLVGLGRIGRCLARKAQGIGLRVVATDPFVSPGVAEEMDIELTPLDQVLRQADFVSLHTPLTHQTRHLIGAAQLALMKSSSYLINCARGPVVDHVALLQALRDHRLAGAGLDVLEVEPPPPALLRDLLALPNVIVTPHVAWYSEESVVDRQRIAAETVAQSLQGEIPCSVVNADAVASRSSIQSTVAGELASRSEERDNEFRRTLPDSAPTPGKERTT